MGSNSLSFVPQGLSWRLPKASTQRRQQRNQGQSADETSARAVSGILIPGERRSEQVWYSNEESEFSKERLVPEDGCGRMRSFKQPQV